jgi:hypothetical protein
VLHQIGVGALGPVFRTYEPTRDRLVAVKVFRLDVTPEQARALADELGRAAEAGLFHPSIVEPVAAGIEGTVAYRAEEYVAAESLDVAMRHYAPATLDKALPFITQLASAIDFARAAGVGHGALHPRDIFVTPDEARATGFGVVDALDRLGLRAPVRRPYSPPERVAGQAWSTPADVFSLAAIAFELLTGRRPSGPGEDMGSLSGATLGDRADAVRAVLVKALHEDPAARHQTAGEFSAALAAAADLTEVPVSLAAQTAATVSVAAPAAAPAAKPSAPVSEPAIVSVPGADAADLPLTVAPSGATAAVDLPIENHPVEAAGLEAVSGQAEDETKGLEDFVGEAEVPLSTDSPREAARKAIAARKRQTKKTVEPVLFEPAARETAPAVEAEAEVAEGALPAVAADPEAPEATEPVLATPEAAEEPAIEEPDTIVPVAASAIEAAPLEAVELAAVDRDPPDRVVAVDEFRAREAAAAKTDRAWGKARPIERPLFERADRVPSFRTSVNAGEGEASLPAPEAAAPERQPVTMLPLALALSLGIIIGLAGGYYWASRETFRTQSVSATAPTTGTETKPPSEMVTPPAGAPAVPSESVTSKPTDPPQPAAGAPPAAGARKPTVSAAPSRPAAPPVAKVGRIVVTSTPAQAAVTVNGKWSGRTPLTLSAVAFGSYVVRVVEPGYEVEREQFTLSSASSSRTIDVVLKRKPEPKPAATPAAAAAKAAAPSSKPAAAATGSIYIDSRPQGARVFVDNKEVGVTPLTLSGQTAGSHDVRLELADHTPRSETITVKPGATARVTGSLERIR